MARDVCLLCLPGSLRTGRYQRLGECRHASCTGLGHGIARWQRPNLAEHHHRKQRLRQIGLKPAALNMTEQEGKKEGSRVE